MASRTMKRKHGGAVKHEKGADHKAQAYNAQGSKEMSEAKEEHGSFKAGGHIKGHHKKRLDKRARGGRTGGGHSPLSSASKESMPVKDMAGKGHMGEMPSEID